MASSLLSVAAPLALSYFAPGLGTSLGTGLGLGIGAGAQTVGNGLIGAGIGALSGGGLKGAALSALSAGIGANLGSLPGAAGSLDSLGREVIMPSGGEGILGSIGNATGLNSGSFPSIGGLTGSSGGGSTFGLDSVGKIAGAFSDDDALKKAQEKLLAGNNQQLANLSSFDPSGITQDPGYEFQRQQGEEGLNRALNAQGSLFSGRAGKALSEYNQNYANTGFNDYYKREMDRINGQNNIYGSSANTQAATGIARSNSFGDALTGVLSQQQQPSMDEYLRQLSLMRS